ncbi:MAG: winged helix DNA-binding protein [Gemmatimonadaceae bacterium]|nr:winged helix DNA-binding protein [Gemmatimonadaceae bacterium]
MPATRTRRSSARGGAPRSADFAAALDAIRRIVQALRVSARAAERRLGVSGAQLFVLHTLADAPAESLNDLAARTFTHQSSVSVVVDRLVRRHLVSRTRSPEDGRRVVLALTPSGRALLRSAPEVAQIRLISALRGLPAQDRKALARILGEVVRAMGAREAPALFFDDLSTDPGTRRPKRRQTSRASASAPARRNGARTR